MSWRHREPFDYARSHHEYRAHHARFVCYVEANGLPCQACGGRGGDYYTAYSEPPEPCGWCETTGMVTRWLRGLYLREMKAEKQRRRERGARKAAA